MSLVTCSYSSDCNGCQLLSQSYEQQRELKIYHLQQLLQKANIPSPQVQFISAGKARLRDRLDFIFNQEKFGLYSKDKTAVVDIADCAQLSKSLNSWLIDFRKIKWPIQKGSIRLRVGPHGLRGCWLDFANLDIKNLIAEKNTLLELLKLGHVEVGQRRKVLKYENDLLKLKSPEFQNWFATTYNHQEFDLFCNIASFTQPSLAANRLITEKITDWCRQIKPEKIVEFGSGIGNLSIPASQYCQQLIACESDELALEAFEFSIKQKPEPIKNELLNKIVIAPGDFQSKKEVNFSTCDLVLVNPPRSGLKNFLNPIIKTSAKPKYFIYMSCYPESFIIDATTMQQNGYELIENGIVDQFPQTEHYEILSLWKQKVI